MKLLEGVYALVEITPSEEFTDCQKYPALAQMFMEEFLEESEDFIFFDMGMENVLALFVDKGQPPTSGSLPHLHSCCIVISGADGHGYIRIERRRNP